MPHSSSGSSPKIGMGRVAELQSPARHISYSPGALLRARHQIRPSSRLPFSSHLSIFSCSLLRSLELLFLLLLCRSSSSLSQFLPPVSPHLALPPPSSSSYLQRWTPNPLYPRLSPGVFTPARRVSRADGATECGIMLSSHGGSIRGLSAGVRS